MASIKKTDAGTWRARLRDPEGKQRTRHFRRKVDAESWVDEITASVVRGDYIDERAGSITVRAHIERYLTMQPLRSSSLYAYESHFRRHVYPVLGDRKLSAVLPSDIQAWVTALVKNHPVKGQRNLAPSTAGVVHGILHGAFKSAVRDRLIRVNPCEGTRLPKAEKSDRVIPLTSEQLVVLRGKLPAEIEGMAMLAATTGMRQAEVFGLTTDRVDFLRRQVRVDRQLLRVPGHLPEFSPPKSEASDRRIPLPAATVDLLAAHLAASPPVEGGEFDGLIFHVDGKPWSRSGFGNLWRPAVAAAGLEGLGMHGLRHYYASLLIRHGESVKTVQVRLGHASAAETLDTYSHLWPDSEDRTREAVDAVFADLPELGAPRAGGKEEAG